MRKETIKFNDFMSGEYKNRQKKKLQPDLKAIAKGSVVLPIISGLGAKYAFASSSLSGTIIQQEAVPVMAAATTDKVMHAFDPLLDLMVSISFPIAGIMLTGGALLLMIGQKERGFSLIMNSALGYVLVQMSPLFLELLASIGNAI